LVAPLDLVGLATAQNEPAIAIFALHHVIIAHFVPDNRMTQGTTAAIAFHFAALYEKGFWLFKRRGRSHLSARFFT
jgi:hypothetical protein